MNPTPSSAAWVHEAMTLNCGVSLLLDRQGGIAEAVGACTALFGMSSDALCGTRLSDLAVERDRLGIQRLLDELAPEQSAEFALLTNDAAVRCRSHWRATRRCDGTFLASGVDPGAPAAQVPAIVNLADAVPALIAYLDKDLRYRFVNTAYERLANQPRVGLYGKRFDAVFDADTWSAIEPKMRAALNGEAPVFEQVLQLRDGRSINTRTQFIPDRVSRGGVKGFYAVIEDVTEYASAIQVMMAVHEAINEPNPDNESTIKRLIGIGMEELGMSTGVVSDTRGGDYVVRYALPDHPENADGIPESIEDTFCHIALKMNGVAATSHAAEDERFRSHPGYARSGLETYIGVPLRDRGSVVGTLSFADSSRREWRFSELELGLVEMLGGAVERLLVQDQFEKGLYRSRLDMERRAKTDELTGLRNRGAIFAEFEQLVGFLQVEPRAASVALLDLDHFKRVNDTHGHQAGDRVLIEVARVFRTAVREGDLVGRAGGEEFLILLPDAGADEAEKMMQRLIERIESLSVETAPGNCIGVTVSVGVAECAPTLRVAEIYSRADKALYRAKDAGRNRVKVYRSSR